MRNCLASERSLGYMFYIMLRLPSHLSSLSPPHILLSPSSQCFLGLRSLLPDCFPILTLLLLFGAGAQKPSGEVHARSEPRETRALVG